MTNPWLDIPLDDYEGHMALPGIEQAQLLSDLFAEVLARWRPASVAVLGCAGGNGFERIPAEVSRVIGVDLNPDFIGRARVRFGGRFETLELIAGDVQTDAVSFAPVDLLFLGLLLEYVDVAVMMRRIGSMLNAGGTAVTVLQLADPTHAPVSPSPYSSLAALGEFMRLVPPAELRALAGAEGFMEIESRVVASVSGKRFQVQEFTRSTA